MRLVLDTNVLVASLTGKAAPRHLVALLADLLHVLSRPMFAQRLRDAGLTAPDLVDDLRRIALVVSPPVVPRVIVKDPDDDHVLACAIVASADLIVSGDSDLLELRAYQGIPILKPAEALARIAAGR